MSVIDTAKEIIYGDREKTYGHPSKNLENIADMWTIYLRGRGLLDPNGDALTATDVCNTMILLKVARLANQPDHVDSIVDIVGYAALIERCKEQV